MAARVEEAYSERTEKVNASGEIVEIEIHYLVFEAADEDAALAAARTKAKAKTVTGMTLESVEVEERVNSTTWRVKAEYASSGSSGGDEGGDGEDTFSTSFDTGGGTMHMNQSLGTTAKAPNDAPDFGGAIGVDGDGNVAGVDVTMPVFNFEETHTLSGTVVTDGWKKKVAAASAKAEFRKALADAQADGDVTDEEESRIRKAQDAYSLAEGLVDKYESKLRSAQEATARQTAVTKPQGTFYARAAQNLRGDRLEQRMLNATQEIAKHTKKTAELLKDGVGGGTMTFQ